MKPTISNAFRDNAEPSSERGFNRIESAQHPAKDALRSQSNAGSNELASMQVDLRETDFGWSLELTPMRALDALQALGLGDSTARPLNFFVCLEQSTWRRGDDSMSLANIAARLGLTPLEVFADDQLVLDEAALRELVSLCQPTRLLVVAVGGPVEAGDALAISRSLDAGLSPLLCELRATAAIEVLGDRNVVLHCRSRTQALGLVAENFRHYLAARLERSLTEFSAPAIWQLQRLLDENGVLTVRPIETQIFATSIDVGVNVSRERFDRPATRSLIYDRPSDSWHDEP